MTTLTVPSFERQLLQTVGEEIQTEPIRNWPQRRFLLCLNIVREIRESAAEARQALEERLSEGVEARSFADGYGPYLQAEEEYVKGNRKSIELLSEWNDPRAEGLIAELRLLEQEERAYRDLLAEALSLATQPSRPVDWERIRRAEEAHSSGETKPFFRR